MFDVSCNVQLFNFEYMQADVYNICTYISKVLVFDVEIRKMNKIESNCDFNGCEFSLTVFH